MLRARRMGAIAAAIAVSVPVPALAQQIRFDVTAQPAVTGIPEFARQAGIQIVSPASDLRVQRTRAVHGTYSVDAGLALLLRGTGLFVALRRSNVISLAIRPKTASKSRRNTPELLRVAPSAPPVETASTEEQSAIVVTGSRIVRPEIDSVMPISISSVEAARSFGYNSVYETLIQSPSVGPGLGNSNSQGEAWDVGVSSINLRSMGVNRSLVLVDGKRWVSGGARTSAVDLNSIPDALIERIEIVTGGAAAIYGADAVTGAVNIITKKKITGVRLSASTGISQSGDAQQSSFSATTGFSFGSGRGSFQIGGTYNATAPIGYPERYANRIGFVPNPANTAPKDGVPDNVLDTNIRDLKRAAAPTIYYNDQWYIFEEGVLRRTGYDTVRGTGPLATGHGGVGLNGFENHFLRNKLELGSVYSRLGYEISPAISWNATLAYARSYARAPTVFPEVRDDLRPNNWWGGTTGEVATLTNPYLPSSLRQFMLTNGLTSVPLNRTYVNLPRAFETHERDYLTLGTDVGGPLTARLKWSAFVQLGRMSDDVTTTNMIRRSAWLNARDVISDPATGQPVCANATARANGCVPFDFFSAERPGQTFLDYVEADRHEWRRNTLAMAGGSVSGTVLGLPHGDMSIAVGVEWRRETLSTRDDRDTTKLADIVFKPGSDYVLHPALDAARETLDVFGEAVVPLLRGSRFARRLELEGAYRLSRYSDGPTTGTWKAGGSWEPITGMSLRGVYSHSVRVPNFGELYSPEIIQTVGITNDPCSGAFINQGPNRSANCAALLPGVVLPLPFPNSNAPTILLGGNPELTPETSNSFTFGAVVQPRAVPGFDLTGDYWDIRIADVITAIPYLNILNLCVDSVSGTDNFYCRLIRRNSGGQIVSINASNYNLARQRARGIDIGVRYRWRVGPGEAAVSLNGTYLLEQTTIGAPGTDEIDFAGQWNYPRFRASLMANYRTGRMTFGLSTRFISRSVFDVTDASPETRAPYYVPAYVTNDIMVKYRPTDQYGISLGVRNVGDVGIFGPLQNTAPGPNSTGGAQTGAAFYDVVGRYLFAKIDLKF